MSFGFSSATMCLRILDFHQQPNGYENVDFYKSNKLKTKHFRCVIQFFYWQHRCDDVHCKVLSSVVLPSRHQYFQESYGMCMLSISQEIVDLCDQKWAG